MKDNCCIVLFLALVALVTQADELEKNLTRPPNPAKPGGLWMLMGGNTNKFSALFCSAAFVKLKEPVRIVLPSITMILFVAMACLASMKVGIPRPVASEEKAHAMIPLASSGTKPKFTAFHVVTP